MSTLQALIARERLRKRSRPSADDRRPVANELADWPSDERRELVEDAMAASEPLLKEIWDNEEDAAYDAS